MTRKETAFLKKYNTLLHNKYVLFFVLFVAILNLGAFVYTTDLKSVGIFFLTGLLTSYFSKNTVVILVVAMVVANIIRQNSDLEGFKKKKRGLQMKKKKKKKRKEDPLKLCDTYEGKECGDDEKCIKTQEKCELYKEKWCQSHEEVVCDDGDDKCNADQERYSNWCNANQSNKADLSVDEDDNASF